jgi:hypothetical protein
VGSKKTKTASRLLKMEFSAEAPSKWVRLRGVWLRDQSRHYDDDERLLLHVENSSFQMKTRYQVRLKSIFCGTSENLPSQRPFQAVSCRSMGQLFLYADSTEWFQF